MGYDLARALAVFGMVVVNFKIVLGAEQNGPAWLVNMVGLLSGRAAATFVVLAGIGLSLVTRNALDSSDQKERIQKRHMFLKRALFLLVAGLAYTPIWPADILHFYGIYIALATGLLWASTRQLWVWCGVVVFLFPLMLFTLNYDQGWNWETLDYAGFWTPAGMIRHLFFNGFHPVVPWIAFLLLGMIIGRQNMGDYSIRRRVFNWGLGVAIAAESASRLLVYMLVPVINTAEQEDLAAILGIGPMPPMPLYMLAGAGTACVVISASIEFGERFKNARWLRPFTATGQLALTLYVAHVIVGMGILEAIGRLETDQSLKFAVVTAVGFCAAGVAFAYLWRSRFKQGPVEAFMKAVCKTTPR